MRTAHYVVLVPFILHRWQVDDSCSRLDSPRPDLYCKYSRAQLLTIRREQARKFGTWTEPIAPKGIQKIDGFITNISRDCYILCHAIKKYLRDMNAPLETTARLLSGEQVKRERDANEILSESRMFAWMIGLSGQCLVFGSQLLPPYLRGGSESWFPAVPNLILKTSRWRDRWKSFCSLKEDSQLLKYSRIKNQIYELPNCLIDNKIHTFIA